MNILENKEKFQKECYERYKLQWMIDHGYTLQDLKEVFEEILGDILLDRPKGIGEGCILESDIRKEVFEVSDEACDTFLNEYGFNGSLYVCYGEFLCAEYQDEDFMRTILSPEEHDVWRSYQT